MYYAPMLIPTLCRYEHFVKCIESLKKNSWAKYTDVYIALDYPAKETHWEGYQKICMYLEQSFDEFANFYVIKRDCNYGSSKNMIELRNTILEKYDCFIRTDDDCEFSPNFLEYMDKCLDAYKDDESVMGITGYSYPVNWDIDSSYNAFKNSLIFPMWGTGFWKTKFLKMKSEIDNGFVYHEFKNSKKIYDKMTNARYLDCINDVFAFKKNALIGTFSDVGCGCYIQLADKYIITPTVSKVRNYGFDGSGVYCQNTIEDYDGKSALSYNYQLQDIDENKSCELRVEEHYNEITNKMILDRFDCRSKKTIFMANIKYVIKTIIIKVIGEDFYKWLIYKKNGKNV